MANTNNRCSAAFGGSPAVACCSANGSFGSNDCPAGQHHCGLLCSAAPCCPNCGAGGTDPAQMFAVHLDDAACDKAVCDTVCSARPGDTGTCYVYHWQVSASGPEGTSLTTTYANVIECQGWTLVQDDVACKRMPGDPPVTTMIMRIPCSDSSFNEQDVDGVLIPPVGMGDPIKAMGHVVCPPI
jgi:hypothetical protein